MIEFPILLFENNDKLYGKWEISIEKIVGLL
jgi:hypothetical protein